MKRRDYRNEETGPERAAGVRPERQDGGALRWFNLRQQHAAGPQQNAMQAALERAGWKHGR